jgi:hypothetical protein
MAARYASFKDYPRREDPDGRHLCAWCSAPLTGRRRRYCSPACRAEVEVRCGFDVRRRVLGRDGGVCARCGLDTLATRKRLRQALDRHKRRAGVRGDRYALFCLGRRRRGLLHRFWARLGLTPHEAQKSLWDAHHKVPVASGAPPCGLDGYETLCVWCHKRETAARARKGAGSALVHV